MEQQQGGCCLMMATAIALRARSHNVRKQVGTSMASGTSSMHAILQIALL